MATLPDTQELREMLQDKDELSKVANYFLKATLQEASINENEENKIIYEFAKLGAEHIIDDAIEIIFEYTESPIEKILVSSLLLCAMNTAPLWLVVQPPAPDISSAMKNFRNTYKDCQDTFSQYEKNTGKHLSQILFSDEFDNIKNKVTVTDEDKRVLSRHFALYETLALKSAFHLVIQPGMRDIKISGKTIRPDMFFWIPNDTNLKIVVECDGFKFHSDKDSFTRDRQRDRKLQLKGYKVLRFSGTEIYHNPTQTSYEILDYLFRSIGSETGPPSLGP